MDRFTVAVVVDLDDYLDTAQSRGPDWATATHVAAGELVRGACRDHAGAQIEEQPPDSWLITLSRATGDAIAAEAHTLAFRVRNEIAAHSPTTASVAISRVIEGDERVRRAVGEAQATLGRKTLGGTGRVLATTEHRSFPAPDISREVAALLRAGATSDAVARVERWIGLVLHRQASPSLLFGAWLPGLVLDVAAAVDPCRTVDGSPDWRSTLVHTPIAELADLAAMHERSHLHRWLTSCFTRLARVALRDQASPLAERAEQLLRARFTEAGLSLGDAAAALAVSPYHLAHVLQRERNTTFRSYLTGLRVRKALGLLGRGDLPIGEIAGRCGFHTTRQFRATLQREIGLAPSRLRPAPPALSRRRVAG
jgi:AraC-like DNA-binding protein